MLQKKSRWGRSALICLNRKNTSVELVIHNSGTVKSAGHIQHQLTSTFQDHFLNFVVDSIGCDIQSIQDHLSFCWTSSQPLCFLAELFM